MRLKDKSALITGGTSGIGLATAKRFIAEGARVAVTGRDEAVFERVRAELGEHALVLGRRAFDQDMRAIAAEVGERFGGVDIVFANAGWAFPSAVNDIDDALYDEIMDINVKGVVFTLQAVLPHCERVRHSQHLVRRADRQAWHLVDGSREGRRAIACPQLVLRVFDRKIRFNAIAPGAIDTPC